jgi:site-specific recombinase XerD
VTIESDNSLDAWLASEGFRPTTCSAYRSLARNLLERNTGRLVAPERARAWILEAQAPATRRNRKNVARRVFAWMGEPDPVQDLRIRGGGVRLGRWLSHDEARKLVGACADGTERGLRDAAILVTMLLTGLRVTEAVSLKHLDYRAGQLRVMGKGQKMATVPVPGQAQRAIDTWLQVKGPRRQPAWPLFPRGEGKLEYHSWAWPDHYSQRSLAEMLSQRAHQAGLGHVAPHDLRRSFCGWLDEDGIDLRLIQAAMRHSSPAVTAVYLTSSSSRAARAVEGLCI